MTATMERDPNRQTGRTTKQLEEAAQKGAVFIVPTLAMRDYTKRLMYAKGIGPVRIEVLTEKIAQQLRGRAAQQVVVDHAVWECSHLDLQDLLRAVLAQISTPEQA